ncbi:WD domain, G-beta repeat containing protein, putative [Babesia bigemina]|uniref:WD domain, G-beta repeat containing protein, putative n=1 Tax=Babesia bigemina TaxID=5866 RepID=A0A061D502_BABBI|nr:WD domain, G-beta repeat containing protein, putative [Babesia bigemina]CDR95766.1 WD domain, G-beta repeat containing protein, putative [Babesia bigemina]|eukprot:XP_012767952.1 WD domain, G-beta repeat containing protein, putative [Babesia bigemina]
MNILNALEQRRRAFGVGCGRRVVQVSLDEPGVPLASFIAKKLKPYSRLHVHSGCVNRLRWHNDGKTLASVSDDLTIALTNVHDVDPDSEGDGGLRAFRTSVIPTQHVGNIFGVSFLAGGRRIATGARDSRVCISDVVERQTVHCYRCHSGSVKHIINDGLTDFVFYSGSYDGTVRQFDIREPHSCDGHCRNIIVALGRGIDHNPRGVRRRKCSWADAISEVDRSAMQNWVDLAYAEAAWANQSYDGTEVKAIAINPVQSEQLAIAASDSMVRIFDRRKLSMGHAYNDGISVNYTMPILEEIYMPKHFKNDETRLFATYLAWSPDGERLAVTYESEHVYLFDRNFTSVGAINTGHPGTCEFQDTCGNNRTTARIRELESHYAVCRDKACAQRNVSQLLYLLLYRNHVGDAALCESIAKEAFLADPANALLLFRRVQASLLLDNYYMARRLCFRGARLFPDHAAHFNKIRRLCLLLLNEKIREIAAEEITSLLKSICTARAITSPNTDIYAEHTIENIANEGGESDDEMHVSIGASFRYSISGWRRWPHPETCIRLEEHLRGAEGKLEFEDSPSQSEAESDGEIAEVEYQHEVDIDEEHSMVYQLRSAADFSPRERRWNMHHYVCFDADEGGAHPHRPAYPYESYPIPYVPEHDLYRAIENPSWRPAGNCRRLCGHCNFGTDIAEVNFWGNDVIVSGSADGAVYLYDVKSGRILDILNGHGENVNCVQVNQQGTLLATSGIDHYIQVWRPSGDFNGITVSAQAKPPHDHTASAGKRS